ncbi:MAG TPA: D-alanyl-D-alanine carboxypeptidase/D-alanyl-D-alanine-endopeptidase, partial [Bacteroidota bacterium]|nr:D-alanyl-D-alanine carboxypeptidase/D-alanyl-D-alanine-endopeptidase [Bacteroidota bacterium]
LYDLNGELTLTPASNQKLFTSACALSELGGAYQFRTGVFVDTASSPRIIVRASGDPLLTTKDLDTLAAAIRAAVPPEPSWTVAGDLSMFDDLPRGEGWTWDDEPDPSAMFISPLSLNGNTVRVLVRPGKAPGDSARVEVDPPTSYVEIENSATTDTAGSRSTVKVSRNWREHLNSITVTGSVSPHDTLIDATLSITDPHWYTLTVLREKLEAWGLKCNGILLDTVPRGAPEIARRAHRLDSVLTYMNTVSDNLSAENVLKTIAAERSGIPGSAAAGAAVVRRFLGEAGIDTSRIVIADGSGVSRYNLTSASAITTLLAAMRRRTDIFRSWYLTLPEAGVSGTISGRMRGTPAQGNLRAKTGTLEGVSSLSGYVTTADGEELAFSILMQQYPAGAREYRRVQDRIGAFLAGLKRKTF